MPDLEMIRSTADFQQLQAQSHTRAHPALLVRFRRNGLERTRFGFSTGRRIGSAIVRNRVRRRLRSVLRPLMARIALGWDVLIVARPPAAALSQRDLAAVLSRLLGNAGILAPVPVATPEPAR